MFMDCSFWWPPLVILDNNFVQVFMEYCSWCPPLGLIWRQKRYCVQGILFMVPTSWSNVTTEALLCSGDTVCGAHLLVWSDNRSVTVFRGYCLWCPPLGLIWRQKRYCVQGILFVVPTSWSDLTTELLTCSGNTVCAALQCDDRGPQEVACNCKYKNLPPIAPLTRLPLSHAVSSCKKRKLNL